MALPPRHDLAAGDSQPRPAAGSPAGPLRDTPDQQAEAHEVTPAPLPADHGTINATIVASFLLRFASRISFSLLVFALGQRIASATIIVLVLEAFYFTELTLSPLTGTVSDRAGRKPFLLAAPVTGAAAALWLWFTAAHLPAGPLHHVTGLTVAVIVGVLVGRLLEGCTTGMNAPAALGALTDATAGHERVRVRALTAFEAVTIAGLALAIPFAGELNARIGLRGFLVVAAIDLTSLVLLARFVSDRAVREPHAGQHALRTSLRVLREPRVVGFLPAWCAVNAIAGIWITLGLLVLTYADPAADARFPNQLLYGGFTPRNASLIVGGFGVLFLLAMGAWSQIVPRLPRTSTMLIAVAGLAVSLVALAAINGIGGDPYALPPHVKGHLFRLVTLAAFGILLLGGFPPAALSLVARIADSLPRHGGAVLGIYAFGLGASQLIGTVLGGLAVDRFGIYGLLGFSVLLGVMALASILATRAVGYDSAWRNSGAPAP